MGRFSYLFSRITDREIKEIVKSEETFIKDLNRDQMYEKGVMDIEKPGKKLQYAVSTKRQKAKKARFNKTDFITLRWMGDFYDSLKVLLFSNRFVISSDSTIWARFLEPQDRFGDALGLTEESKDKLRDKLKPTFIKWLKTRK